MPGSGSASRTAMGPRSACTHCCYTCCLSSRLPCTSPALPPLLPLPPPPPLAGRHVVIAGPSGEPGFGSRLRGGAAWAATPCSCDLTGWLLRSGPLPKQHQALPLCVPSSHCRPRASFTPHLPSPPLLAVTRHPLQARLEVLDAETEGQLGYILELELHNALRGRQVAALLTQARPGRVAAGAGGRGRGGGWAGCTAGAAARRNLAAVAPPPELLACLQLGHICLSSRWWWIQRTLPSRRPPSKWAHTTAERSAGAHAGAQGACFLCWKAGGWMRASGSMARGAPTSSCLFLQEAEAHAKEKGWAIAPDGDAFRRVVASPLPRDIVESRAVQVLLQVRSPAACCCRGCTCCASSA